MQSNISMTYKDELLEDIKDKEYRNAFVSSHISNGIPFQIKTMRNNRKMIQKELGKLARMKQTAICRLENPNYGNFTLKTLKAIAAAFDVALIVRFVPFSELVKWDLKLSAHSLEVPSFDQDNFAEITADHKQYPPSTKKALSNIEHIILKENSFSRQEILPVTSDADSSTLSRQNIGGLVYG